MNQSMIRRISQQCCLTSALVACGGGPHISAESVRKVCDGCDANSSVALSAALHFLRSQSRAGSWENVVAPLIHKFLDLIGSHKDDVSDWVSFIAGLSTQVKLVYTSVIQLDQACGESLLILGLTAKVRRIPHRIDKYRVKALVFAGPEHFWTETLQGDDSTTTWTRIEVNRDGVLDRTQLIDHDPLNRPINGSVMLKFVVFEHAQDGTARQERHDEPVRQRPRSIPVQFQDCIICSDAKCVDGLHSCLRCFKQHVKSQIQIADKWQLSCPTCHGQRAHNFDLDELEQLVEKGYMERRHKILFSKREATAKDIHILNIPRCQHKLVDSITKGRRVCNAHVQHTDDAYAVCLNCFESRCKQCGGNATRRCTHENVFQKDEQYRICPKCKYARLLVGELADDCWATSSDDIGCGGVTCPGCFWSFNVTYTDLKTPVEQVERDTQIFLGTANVAAPVEHRVEPREKTLPKRKDRRTRAERATGWGGRQRRKRRKADARSGRSEDFSPPQKRTRKIEHAGGASGRCSICRRCGHNARTCPEVIK
eukprot:SAG31_NODE_346_length_17349_cov_9.825875_1_plen_540_part_00